METRKQKDSPRGSPGLHSPPSSPSLLTGKAIYIVTSFVSSGKMEIISNGDVSLQAFTKESKVKEYMKKHDKKLHDSKVSGPHKDSEHNTYFEKRLTVLILQIMKRYIDRFL